MGCLCSKSGGDNAADDDVKAIRDANLPIIWVLGGPGSGKGTQCAKLAETFNLKHLSTGDLLRAEVASGSAIGKSINETMEKGELVDRYLVLDLLKKSMAKDLGMFKGFLIDGYPREVEQGEDFETRICPCSMILYLMCSDDTMKERLMSRQRSDDNEETIMKRLETFHNISEPVMAKYTKKVVTIDANVDVDTAFQAAQEQVGTLIKE